MAETIAVTVLVLISQNGRPPVLVKGHRNEGRGPDQLSESLAAVASTLARIHTPQEPKGMAAKQ